jgi:hypothetical protein
MSDAEPPPANSEPLTKVVASAVPLQFTTELGTELVALTVSVKPDPPGGVLAETMPRRESGHFTCKPARTYHNVNNTADAALDRGLELFVL